MRNIAPEILKQNLCYCPETGKLFWKSRSNNAWNAKYAGKEAFTATDAHGYKVGNFQKTGLKAHRVIWAIAHGEWPNEDIDHINGNRSDNRLSNLRAVSRRENMRNRAACARNTSGIVGVSFHKATGKWRARLGVNDAEIYLGLFDTKEEAAKARAQAAKDIGFHVNHGRVTH